MVASRQRDQGQVLGVTLSCDVVSLVTVGFLSLWLGFTIGQWKVNLLVL